MKSFDITLDQLPEALERGAKHVEQMIRNALGSTAEKAVTPIRSRVPVAFGELRDSVQASDIFHAPKTHADAPHAAAVEIGSLPHTPNIEALIKWVKLRGMQGLSDRSGHRPSRFDTGPTTAYQAKHVASMLKEHEIKGTHSPVDAAEQVAYAIAKGIQEHGTRPHWMFRNSLQDIRVILDQEVRSNLKK